MIHLAVAIVSFFVVFTAGCMLLGALCRLLNGAQRAVKAIAREVMAPVYLQSVFKEECNQLLTDIRAFGSVEVRS